MRKVVGIGETILDIISRSSQPSAVAPGGSAFDDIIPLERMEVNVYFTSETGNDHVGNIILQFMRDGHIPTNHVGVFPNGKSPVSLALLNKHSNAECILYKNHPKQRLDVSFPPANEDDIIVIDSYYTLNPVLRDKILELLDIARERKAIVYYDPNFRSSYKNEAMKLASATTENPEYVDIVGGSLEDFYYMHGTKDTEKICKDKIKFYYPLFLCIVGAERISLHTSTISKEYPVTLLQAVSTTGTGDNSNTGLIYDMLRYDVRYRGLQNLSEETWDKVVQYGQDFSVEIRKSFDNSMSEEFVTNYR